LKHVAPLDAAPDWWTFALPGDGSIRGLNRVRRRAQESKKKKWDKRWPEWHWHLELTRLADQVAEAFAAAGLPRLDLQNLQNVLCEFDKYERTRETGQIPPSQRYKPADIAPPPRPKKPPKPGATAPKPEPKATPVEPKAVEPEPIEPKVVAPEKPSEPHCLAAALDYAQRCNWKIFLAPPGAKKSYRKAPPGGERWGATRNVDEIRQDFAAGC
jgi:hypothetical protein